MCPSICTNIAIALSAYIQKLLKIERRWMAGNLIGVTSEFGHPIGVAGLS
jgi:hypothetical protein